MKRNTDLVALAQEVQRQLKSRRDFVAPTPAIEMEVEASRHDPATAVLQLKVGENRFGVRPFAHKQISEHLQIPARFYDRLQYKEPNLLATTINTLFAHDRDNKGDVEKRMVRTLDGDVRAVVSPRFFALDNFDLLEHLIPTIKQMDGTIVNCQLTERHLYIVVTNPRLRVAVEGSKRVGDLVEAGAMVGNSEIGDGTLYVKPYANYLVCLNGAVRDDMGFKRYHLGKSVEAEAEVRELLSDEARVADAKAIFLKLRDVFRAAFDEARFKAYVNRVSRTTQDAIEIKNVDRIVEVAVKELELPEKAKDGVLAELIKAGDFSRYGLFNAVTAQAHTEDDTETAIGFEKAGSKIIELSAERWKRISEGKELEGGEQQAA